MLESNLLIRSEDVSPWHNDPQVVIVGHGACWSGHLRQKKNFKKNILAKLDSLPSGCSHSIARKCNLPSISLLLHLWRLNLPSFASLEIESLSFSSAAGSYLFCANVSSFVN